MILAVYQLEEHLERRCGQRRIGEQVQLPRIRDPGQPPSKAGWHIAELPRYDF